MTLHGAALEGRLAEVAGLIAAGADVNAVDPTSKTPMTPLSLAVANCHSAVADLLLAERADPNARDADGRTPLHWASVSTWTMLLVHARADPGVMSASGETPASRSSAAQLAVLREAARCPRTPAQVVSTLAECRRRSHAALSAPCFQPVAAAGAGDDGSDRQAGLSVARLADIALDAIRVHADVGASREELEREGALRRDEKDTAKSGTPTAALADAIDSGDGRSVAPATAAGADMAITSTGAAAAASSTATAGGGGGGGGSAPKSDPAVVTRPQRVPPPARSTVRPLTPRSSVALALADTDGGGTSGSWLFSQLCGGRPEGCSKLLGGGLSRPELSGEEQLRLRRLFDMFDSDGSGHVDETELEGLLQLMGDVPRKCEVDELLRKLDTDGSGTLSFDEFVAMYGRRQQEQQQKNSDAELEAALAHAFVLIDSDGSGSISADELAAAFAEWGESMSEEEVVQFVAVADTDQSGRITYAEFRRMACWRA